MAECPKIVELGVLAISLALLYFWWSRPPKASIRLPPGPRPLPILGNILDINTARPWLTYSDWKEKYGSIVSCRLLGQTVVILNTEKISRELLEQRSYIYSDRPDNIIPKLFGIDYNTGFLPYGEKFRQHRRLLHRTLRAEAAGSYQDLYLKQSRKLLQNMLECPDAFEKHLQLFVASITMEVTYGQQTVSWEAPPLKSVAELVVFLHKALPPERSAMLTAFPFLRHIPAWVPGAAFKRAALRCQDLSQAAMHEPFNLCKEQIAAGLAPKSMVQDLLDQVNTREDIGAQEQTIREIGATVFVSGFSATSSTLSTFILAMVLYPDVQERGRAEIDSVVGGGRFPDFNDRAALPYVEAIMHETFRWNIVSPLGLPHVASVDDNYDGYFIPKGKRAQIVMKLYDLTDPTGALVIANIWETARENYAEPDLFKPERHLTEDGHLLPVPLSTKPVFGYGRRGCPGKFVAEAVVWSAMVHILSAFRLEKAVDGRGDPIEVKAQFTDGLTTRPLPFVCSIKSRNAERENMIRTE